MTCLQEKLDQYKEELRMSIGDPERATQDRVVSFFKDRDILDYNYLDNLQDVENKNIREDRLRAYLRLSGYSQKLIDGAVAELVKAAGDMMQTEMYIHF